MNKAPFDPLEPPKKLLFIGNSISYWNLGVDFYLKGLANSADPPISFETDTSYISQASLANQWLEGNAREMIVDGSYDAVILQEEGNRNFSKSLFFTYTRSWTTEIRNAGSVPVLYMPNPFSGNSSFSGTSSIEDIIQAHNEIAAELDLSVAPNAVAWLKIAIEEPDFNLFDEHDPYVSYLGGKAHPNVQGSYLGASIIYATLFGDSPEGLSFIPYGMTEDEAAFLQRIAWETVKEYQSQQSK